MRLLIWLSLLLAAAATPALAVTDSPALPKPYCLYVTADPTLTNGEVHPLRCDASGNLQIAGGATAANQTAAQATPGSDASKAVAVQGVTGGKAVPGSIADGLNTTQGAKADAKSTATDTTAVTIMQVLKEISAMAQAPPAPLTVATPTDKSGTLTTGGTSQTLAAANASRKCLFVQNPITATEQNIAAAENLYLNDNAAAAVVGSGANYAVLGPGGSATFCFPNGLVDQTAITVNATTINHRWYAKEY